MITQKYKLSVNRNIWTNMDIYLHMYWNQNDQKISFHTSFLSNNISSENLKSSKLPRIKCTKFLFCRHKPEEVSICFWVSVQFEHHAEVLSRNEKHGIQISFQAHGNYIEIDSYSIGFEFPRRFYFIPEKWMSLCLTLNKMLKVYLNSELMLERDIYVGTKDFELPVDFLKNLQIGKASKFAIRT